MSTAWPNAFVATAAMLLLCAVAHVATVAHAAAAAPHDTGGVEINLGTVTCEHYQDDILHAPRDPASAMAAPAVDPIDTTMWLLGFSIGKTGEHMMYGDALTNYGFALDAECRNNPSESLLRAVTKVKSKHDKPMDLQRLNCEVWTQRHAEMQRTDSESANTLMMWMYGFSVAQNGGQTLQSGAASTFTAALENFCAAHPSSSMADALVGTRPPGVPPRAADKPKAHTVPNAPH